ncbi:ketopantoate reductase family protein [Ramlibacter rhizophilus]|uniref:2-dehydropantoate 2-reductase n=1 Tax=Ramlibacter rhizophilus TaxID=1781167 RepID=A0A4Z0BGW5_9BURK|nr:2-dehydropantoate 2-reductase [Ramlibacter rhizophilus]TFY97507.1 2-dehydropantoate 2-reductase [Ramlibacter rhizophilus]
MHVAVLGAGAVGSYFGAMLARAGHEVTLVARAAHVQAIRQHGLLLDAVDFREHVQLRADTQASAVAGAQLVLCCVKSTDTAATAAELRPHLAPDALVLSLQNGIENAPTLQALLPQRVVPAVVYVAVEVVAPGCIRHRGRGELVIAEDPRDEALAARLRGAGIPVRTTPNLSGAQWDKLIVNCAFNALSAIPQLPYGPLLQGEGVRDVMADLTRECLAVAEAAGVQLTADPWDALQRTGRQLGQSSSMAQDLARGRRTEIDHLNGYVVRRGAALGVPTPANRMLVALVKLLEEKSANGRGAAPADALA